MDGYSGVSRLIGVDFKQEAIQSMVMGTFTKIYLRFPQKFWFDTEVHIINVFSG